jgi:hypothetical protein
MTTTLTARGPADLLAAVPVVLGFRPRDSLVMLTFDAVHSFHARVDLPPPDEAAESLPELVDGLLAPALSQRARRVVFVSYSDDAEVSALLSAALCEAFVGAGIDVLAVLRAHDGTWCLVPPCEGLAETSPTPYDDTSHPFAAQAVFEGVVTHASRDALRDTLAARPDDVARVQGQLAGLGSPASDELGWVRTLVLRCATTGDSPTDLEAARVLRAVVRADVRDAALYAVTRDSADDHLQVWAGLLRRAPDAQVPDAAAITAFCAWQAGHGALAWCAVDRCLEIDPRHRLGLCLAECLTRAVPPSAWEEVGDRRRTRTGRA